MRVSAAEIRCINELFPDAVAARRNLLALGLSSSTISRRCRLDGPWRSPLPGVVLLNSGEPTRRQRIRAALIYAGVPAMLTATTALRRHGVQRLGDERHVELLVPHERQLRGRGFVVVTRTRRMPEPVWRDGLPLAPVARALVDAAATADRLDAIRAMFADAIQRGVCRPEALATELAELRRPHTGCARAVLAEIDAGVRSAAESWARHLVVRSDLPPPRWNVALRRADGSLLGVADAWWDVGLVWEIDSREWHLSPADHDRDTRRQSRFAAHGLPVVHTRPSRLRHDGATVLDELTGAYRNAALTPPPQLVAVPWRP
ncbi:MAG: hypothetical protein ACT4RN_05920 [Pseudonocardia sp.]